ncbi:MAG: tRNA N6-adenosine threonylcarbamoyltransferase [Planctomycetota bacterium]|jgi:N6-L-threonylcarbamoyladenine synthase
MGLILGIESSCDETAAAVVDETLRVRSSVVASQEDLHAEFGGVVPEIASRAHLERVLPVIRKAIDQSGAGAHEIIAVAAGVRPGLIGSLLVGTTAAKAYAWGRMLPFHAVDHVAAHLFSGLLRDDEDGAPTVGSARLETPALGLVVSGGHTSLFRIDDARTCTLLGRTIDDAVGEALDKAAVMLGLGHPGGPNLERCAEGGDPDALRFSLPNLPSPLDFSLSGLKTKLLYEVRGVPRGRGAGATFERSAADLTDARRRDLAASFQAAAVRQVMDRVRRAAEAFAPRMLLVGGGVVANRLLRAELASWADSRGVRLVLPARAYCGDNAAMIAGHAQLRRALGDGGDDLATPAEPVSILARGSAPKRVQ